MSNICQLPLTVHALHRRNRRYVPLKCWYPSARLHYLDFSQVDANQTAIELHKRFGMWCCAVWLRNIAFILSMKFGHTIQCSNFCKIEENWWCPYMVETCCEEEGWLIISCIGNWNILYETNGQFTCQRNMSPLSSALKNKARNQLEAGSMLACQLECWLTFGGLHGVISQKIELLSYLHGYHHENFKSHTVWTLNYLYTNVLYGVTSEFVIKSFLV
jgi:hypothetical protein